MSGLTAEQGCTCASVDGYRVKSRACPTHGPTMPPPRPAHEDPLRRTFTREQLAEAVEQARAEERDYDEAQVEAGARVIAEAAYESLAWDALDGKPNVWESDVKAAIRQRHRNLADAVLTAARIARGEVSS